MAATTSPTRGAPLLEVTTRPARWEVWTNLACLGGTIVRRFRAAIDPRLTWTLAGDTRLTLALPLTHDAAADLRRGRVLRAVLGTAWDEWTILTVQRSSREGLVRVTCGHGPAIALTRLGPLGETVAGRTHFEHEWVSRTPTALLAVALADTTAWCTLGTVELTAPIPAMTFRGTRWAAVQAIAREAGGEWQLRRNGTLGYLVDIVTRVGAANPLALVASKRDLVGADETESVLALATRVVPLGQETDGVRATMARAPWEVTAVGASRVTLADPAGGDGPILHDGQLNGFYLRTAAGVLRQITNSLASLQAVDVASTTGILVGDRVTVCLNAAGDDLPYLTHQVAELAEGAPWVEQLDVGDVPGVVNVIPNPACRTWPAALPTGWTLVGAPTATKQTTAPFVETAGQSLKLVAAADAGVQSPWGKVTPSAERPYLGGFGQVWVVSGSVRAELVLDTPGGVRVRPLGTQRATNSALGLWTAIGVSGLDGLTGAEDPELAGVTRVAVRLVAHGGPATFYVDHVQAAADSYHSPFVEGAGPTLLWQAANRRLAERATLDGVETLAVAVADLRRLDPVAWGTLPPLSVGGAIDVREASLALSVRTRIIALTIPLAAVEQTALTLSTEPADFGRLVAGPRRAGLPRAVPTVAGPRGPKRVWLHVSETTRTTTKATIRVRVCASEPCGVVTVTPSMPQPTSPAPTAKTVAAGLATYDPATTAFLEWDVTLPAGPRFAASVTFTPSAAGFEGVPVTIHVTDIEGQRRAWLALSTTGHLNPTTKSGTLFISKGLWATSAAHEELVSFNFASIPRVLPTMIGGNISDPRPGGWSGPGFNPALPVHCEVAAEDVSPLGFRAKAELVQRGSVLGREHAMTPAPLVGVGDLASATLTAAPASGNRYRVYFHPKVTALVHSEAGDEWSFASLVLGVYVNDGTGFTHVASRSYVVNETASSTKDFLEDFVEFVRSGLDSTDQVKLQVDAFHLEPGSAGGSFEVLTPRVEYTTAAGEARKSMTPDGEQNLYHLLISEETS